MFGRLSVWAACLVAGLGAGVFRPGGGGTVVAFLAVGQGDCTLIKSGDWVALIDAGPRTDHFDAGKRLVVPELRRLGVRKIDCLFITHPDIDHVGGLKAVHERFRIGKVVVSQEFEDDEAMMRELARARFKKAEVTWIAGITQTTIDEVRLTVAAPTLERFEGDNEGSLFIRIDALGGSVMTTGDADTKTEDEMKEVWDWDVQILKAGHHGSRGSMSADWLEETSPKTVVASCGVRNRYGHPAKDAVDRVGDYGAQFLRTDRQGTVVFHATPAGFIRD